MKAQNITGTSPGGKRQPLTSILPLDTPLVIQVFPIYACNFKCKYCIFSTPKTQHNFISNQRSMDFSLYKKAIDSISEFPQKIKVLRFVGIGEPLLHPQIVDMIQYASNKKVANTIEILTNGSLLTPTLSNTLISSGLNRMVISLQGTSSSKYHKLSGININFNNFIENIKYFYNHKKNTHLYLKIIDVALDSQEDTEKFYSIFGDICDTIAIERAVPIHNAISMDLTNNTKTQFNNPLIPVQICPQPFFTLQLNPDGNVVPCYSWKYPIILGNANHQTIPEIWNGTTLKQFRLKLLNKDIMKEECGRCNIIKYRMPPEDDLSKDINRLKTLYK